MSGAQKISLSLLISVVVFSVLSVLAVADRFRALEARFYVPRVEESVRLRAHRATELYDRAHRTNIARFQEFTLEPAVRAAFRINASSTEILERRNRLDSLERELASLDLVRIIDVAATELHYSSNPADYTESGTVRTYLRPDQASADDPLSLLSLAYYERMPDVDALPSGESLPGPDIFLEPLQQQFVYRLPAVDAGGVMQGVVLFYVNTSDLRTSLLRAGLTGAGDAVRIVNSDGLIANAPMGFAADLAEAASSQWGELALVDGRRTITSRAGPTDRLAGEAPAPMPDFSYEAYPVQSDVAGIMIYLEPSGSLEMPLLLQYTLIVAVFLTTFLIVFLLLNVRQDAIVVISDRVKRFQISLLREYLEHRREIDFRRWKAELEDRRDEVHREIRRGIGRVRPSQEEEVNRLINQSWDEIIAVLSSRADERATASLDVDRIEEIVNQLSERFARIASPAPTAPAPVEVEELEDADEVADLEDAEDLDEAEDLETIAPVAATETAGDQNRPIPVEEVDDADDIDELEDAVEPDGPEELEAVDALDDAPPDDRSAADDRGLLDDLDERVELEWLARAENAELPGGKPDVDLPLRREPTHPDGQDSHEIEEPDRVEKAEHLGRAAEPVQSRESDEVSSLPDGLEIPTELDDGGEDELGELEEVEEPEADWAAEEDDLELLEPAEEETDAAVVEDLTPAANSSTTFGEGLFSFARGTDVRLSNPDRNRRFTVNAERPEDEDPADLEPADVEPDALIADSLIRFTRTREASNSDYEVAALSELLSRLHVEKSILLESDGIVEIGRDVYREQPHVKDEQMRTLVDSVVSPDGGDVRSGIEQLFGDGVDDLLPERDPGERKDPIDRRPTGESVFRFVEQGFDYDGYVRGYQDDDAGVLKSMVRFTRQWDARVGVLYVENDQGLVPAYQLGLNPRCADALKITQSSGLYRYVLSKQHVLFVHRALSSLEYFHDLCEPEHLALFERSLFLPLVFRGSRAYALLGLARTVESLDAAMRSVMPHLEQFQGVRS